jgi:hypothetical protein
MAQGSVTGLAVVVSVPQSQLRQMINCGPTDE